MKREIELHLSTIENIMKLCNVNKRNIAETVERLKTQFPQDVLIIEAQFMALCQQYGFDSADFTTAKII